MRTTPIASIKQGTGLQPLEERREEKKSQASRENEDNSSPPAQMKTARTNKEQDEKENIFPEAFQSIQKLN